MLKGSKHSEIVKQKMKEYRKENGFGKWNKGRKPSEETKRKISMNSSKIWLGKKFSKEHRKNLSKSHIGKIGILAGNWKGGISRNIHGGRENIKWRANVFQRDNWICQTCGKRSQSGEPIYLEAHHIKSWAKYPELRYELNNGITLCRDCHKLTDNYKGKGNSNEK